MELRLRYKGQELVVPTKQNERLSRGSSVPYKKKTKLSYPITKGSSAYYGQGVSSERTTALWILKDRHGRGWTRLASAAEEQRLEHSAKNANTTRSRHG